jgi:DNA-binding response OmpR family regulator
MASQRNSRVGISSRSGEDQNARPSAPRSLCESWSFAYIEKMGLSCLLLTSDATLLKVMRTGFSAASVDLELRTDAAGAIELSSRRHLDGFVIDCDDASGARDVLTKIRSSRSNQLSVIFVVVNATTTIASKALANFVLTKPVPQTQLSGFLDIAVARMAREHRRYFRHKANVPLHLVCKTGGSFAGKIKNVSEGGLALTHFGPTAVEGVVTVQFELPSAQPQTFQAKAAVVWADAYTMGLRFLRIEPGCRSGFEAWLDSLEAQLRFRESIQ